MKKLFLILIVLFAAVAFRPTVSNVKPKVLNKSDSTENISLNGVPESVCDDMISVFLKYRKYDKHPLPVSVHFTRLEIETIVNLLHYEIANDTKGRKDSIDGIRVYFASNTEGFQSGHLQNSVILISTRANGYVAGIGNTHKDYYEHEKGKLSSIKGLQSTDNCSGGAVLFSPCPVTPCPDDNNCDWSQQHYYNRDEGTSRVKNFKITSKNEAINTDSEWYDLKMFEHMLRYDFDGVRIYFARQPKSSDVKISDRNIFIITTTKYDKVISNYRDDFNCVLIHELIKKPVNPKNIRPNSIPIPPQDKGELCPFNCNPTK